MHTTRTPAALAATTLAALLLALPALAQTAPAAPATPPTAAPMTAPAKAPNPNNGHGKITAVSAASITVQPKNGEPKTFAVTPATKITLDGQPATAAALAVGLRASVASKDGATARAIKAHTKKAKVAKAGAKGKKNPFKASATL